MEVRHTYFKNFKCNVVINDLYAVARVISINNDRDQHGEELFQDNSFCMPWDFLIRTNG